MIEFTSVEDILQTILALLVIIILGGAIYSLIRSILLFMFSSGDAENKKKARNRIRFMIIGLMLTVVLLFLFQYILKYIGVEQYEQYSASNIFEKVTKIINKIMSIKNDISNGNSLDNQRFVPVNNEATDVAPYEL